MSKENVEVIELNEISRVYIFPNDQKLTIENAKVCYISEDGTHKLQNEKGEIYIIPYRWLAFKIQEKDTEVKTETESK
jgi:NACalpha-BTF3-like transcription factor